MRANQMTQNKWIMVITEPLRCKVRVFVVRLFSFAHFDASSGVSFHDDPEWTGWDSDGRTLHLCEGKPYIRAMTKETVSDIFDAIREMANVSERIVQLEAENIAMRKEIIERDRKEREER